MSNYQGAAGDVGLAADKEIGSLETTVNSLTEDLTAANTKAAQAEADKVAAEEATKLANNQLALCRARNARLREQLEAQGGTETVMWVGSSCGKHDYDYFTQMAGSPLKARRSYETGPKSNISNSSMRADIGRNISVNSMAFNPNQISQYEDDIESYLNSWPPDHEGAFIVSHEPENPEKKYDPIAYVEQQKRVRVIVDRVNAGRPKKILFGGNWMAWSMLAASHRNMVPWTPPAGTWDFLAWDGYSGDTNSYREVDSIFGAGKAYCTQIGVAFAIAECGIHVEMPVDQRIKWINECQQYAADAKATFWTYWDGSFSTFWLNTKEEFKAVVEGP